MAQSNNEPVIKYELYSIATMIASVIVVYYT